MAPILACENWKFMNALDHHRIRPYFASVGLTGMLMLMPFLHYAVAQEIPHQLESDKRHAIQRLGRLPLSFEENRGQADPHVRYLAHGAGYSIFLTEGNTVLTFSSRQAASKRSSERDALAYRLSRNPGLIEDAQTREKSAGFDTLHMQLAGSRAGVEVDGEDVLPGTVNYFSGKDPRHWRTGIPTYSRVRYSGVYPGVDLVYYGNRQQLEYDFVVAARADAGRIRLRFQGARRLSLDPNGDLAIQTNSGSIRFRKPLVYQLASGHRQSVSGAFRLTVHNTVRFQLGAYDHTKPLVIDPILSYSTFVEGPIGDSGAVGIAVDAAGEAFLTGWSFGGAFPTTPGTFQTTPGYSQGSSVFVSKLSSDGSALLYSTYLEGTTVGSWSNAIAVDGNGDAYVAGYTGDDFPTTPGAFQTTDLSDVTMAFVSELNSTGTGLIYSTYIGGSVSTNPSNTGLPQNGVYGIALDGEGEAFLAGYTYCSDFPTTPGAFQSKPPTGNVNGTGWVAKLNSAGSELVYSTYLGGSSFDEGRGIAIDSAGEAIVAGYTKSTNFPVTPGAPQTTDMAEATVPGATEYTGFVTKLNSTGTQLVFSTFLGGSYTDQMLGAAADTSGNAYVVGTCLSTDFPVTKGAFQTAMSGSWNPCVAKISSDGKALDYATYIGGNGEDTGVAIAVDSSGDAYITGDAGSLNFPVTPGAFQTENYAIEFSSDLGSFLTEINPSGSALVYSTFVGGSGSLTGEDCGCATAIALDSANNTYVAGRTFSEDFRTTPGAYMTTLEADRGMPPWNFEDSSAFVIKFDGSEMKPIPLSTTTVTASPNPQLPLNTVTFTAHVAPSSAGVTPTGLIGFDYDAYVWATATLDSTGSASYSPPASDVLIGPNSMVVLYLGDANNAPSSSTMTENVDLYPTTTTLSISPNSVPFGTAVTFTAAIASTPPMPLPSGTVEFFDNQTGNWILSTAVDGTGHASATTNALPVGTTQFFAFYQTSDNVHASSNSGNVAETILAPPAPPNPVFSPTPGSYSTAQNVTLTDGTAGVAICYTTDGTQPATLCQPPLGSTNVYTQPIPLSQTTTINAMAVAGNATPSPIVTGVYIFGGKPPGFTIAGTAVGVEPGATTANTSTITVTPIGGFIGNVLLSATITSSPSGAQDLPTLSFNSTNMLNLNGPTALLATLTVNTTPQSGTALVYPKRPGEPWYASGAAICCVLLFWSGARRRNWRTLLGMVALLVSLTGGVIACGSGGSNGGNGGGGGDSGTTAGAYTITVTGTSGTTKETSTVTLTVQ